MMRAVILDCFGVLYIDPSKHFYEHYVTDKKQQSQLYELNKQADYGLITQEDLVMEVAEITQLDKKFIQETILGKHVLNKKLLDYAQSLRTHIKVGMLSNISTGSMEQFFSSEQREHLFDAVVLSEEVGLIKPHPEIYKAIANKLNINPSDCVMVDDILDNCYGADAAGMKWIHYTSTPQTIQELDLLLKL